MFNSSGRLFYSFPCQTTFTRLVGKRCYASRGTVSCCIHPRLTLRPIRVVRYVEVPDAYYGGRHLITMLPGGGVGPEMMDYVINVFEAIKAPIDFEIIPIRKDHYKKDLEYAIMSIRRNKACLKAGSIEDRESPVDIASANVEIRRQLDMFVSVVHCLSVPRLTYRHDHINVVVVRQNTEGEYAMLEHESKKGVVESMKVVTRHNCKRIADWLFKYCMDENRKKITVVHKSSIMKLTDGMFLKTIMDMARRHPSLEVNSSDVTDCCSELVVNPQAYDVIITSNLYGSVITNVLCGLIGGPGLLSGRNYGRKYALFETATRNSALELMGKNIANPVAILQAGADLLWHLHHEASAYVIRKAILRCFQEDIKTKEIGGTSSGSEVMAKITEFIKEELELSCTLDRI